MGVTSRKLHDLFSAPSLAVDVRDLTDLSSRQVLIKVVDEVERLLDAAAGYRCLPSGVHATAQSFEHF